MASPNLECRMYETRYPEVDMAVMIQVKHIAEMGAYVSLLEYNNIEGMILFSELSRRRIRSVSSLIKVGRQEPAIVLRVDKFASSSLSPSLFVSLFRSFLVRICCTVGNLNVWG